MVNVGFICEGKTEQEIIESTNFQDWLNRNSLRCVNPVFDVAGSGNLLPHRLADIRDTLFRNGANIIVIITDLDQDECITVTRQRITQQDNQVVIVAVKQIESWFLSDSTTLRRLFSDNTFEFINPEAEDNPFATLKRLFELKTQRGIGTKPMLARRMLKYGFSIENAAQHPNCTSANYFLTKLQTLASAN
ncbi:hypothetical protein GCM10028808_35670 [Spirosoma migulaei]